MIKRGNMYERCKCEEKKGKRGKLMEDAQQYCKMYANGPQQLENTVDKNGS
jgi:hypothetical protein